MRNRLRIGSTVFAALLMLGSGCASYYRVTDPGTGKAFYTKKIKKHGSGTVEFQDTQTRTKVRLSSSQVMKITKTEYELNTITK